MQWVCRTTCFWRARLWEPGQIVEVGGKYERGPWKLGGGWWAPSEIEVIDHNDNLVIPRHFEPLDHSILNSPRELYLAREGRGPARTWKFLKEVEREAPPEDLESRPLPEPLDPEKLKRPKGDPPRLTPGKATKLYGRGKP